MPHVSDPRYSAIVPCSAIGGTGILIVVSVAIEALRQVNAQLAVAGPDGVRNFIAVDQEGGVVQRLRAPATRWPPMMTLDAAAHAGHDEQLAVDVGTAVGKELRAVGFDIDFAPILDVHTNPANPIIGDRAFGTTPDVVARRALAFAIRSFPAASLARRSGRKKST